MAKKRKKVKRNYRRLKKMIVGFIVLFIIGNVVFFNWDRISLWKKGYTNEQCKIILNLSQEEIDEYLGQDKIDMNRWDEYSNGHHYYDYELYEQANPDLSDMTIIKNVDRLYEVYEELINLGFTRDFCREHYADYAIEDFEVFANNQIDYDTAKKYLKVNGVVIEDMPKYVNSGMSATKAVMKYSYGFIDASKKCDYIYEVNPENSLFTIVNDRFELKEDYKPDDLVKAEVEKSSECKSSKLVEEAAYSLEDMVNDAKDEDLNIILDKAYISYGYQEQEYNECVNYYGLWTVENVLQLSKPGCDEHQLATTVNLTCQSAIDGEEDFEDSDEYKWLKKHAHEYGFIFRYPSNKSDITGKEGVSNQFRYVGSDTASEINEDSLCLEEYVLRHGLDYTMKIIEDAG